MNIQAKESTGRTRRTVATHGPEPVDIYVGERLLQLRKLRNVSQEKLGDAVGLSFQQIQKYERGANRISASTLFRLAEFFDVPVGYFFDGLRDRAAGPVPVIDHEDLRTLHLLKRLSPTVRQRVRALLSAVAGDGGDLERETGPLTGAPT